MLKYANLFKYKTLLAIIVFLAFLGFLDSTYLSIKSFQNVLPPCSVAEGCEKVLTSKYSKIGPIPISLPGAVFYVVVMGLVILISQNPKSDIRILFFLVLSGFLISVILFLIQALVIQSFCKYCLFSEGVSTFLLILSIFLIRSK